MADSFYYSSPYEIPLESIRYIQYRWTRIETLYFIPVFLKMLINGILECLCAFFYQWFVRSYKNDCEIFDSFVERYRNEKSQKQKTAIVTGSSSGIGREVAAALFCSGWYVILACRSKEKTEFAIKEIFARYKHDPCVGNLQFLQLDVSCHSSICHFVKEFESLRDSLDLLVNNAGIYEDFFVPLKGGLESQFVTNHLGPFVLAEMLEKFMKTSARIIQVGSVAQYSVHSIDKSAINRPELFFQRGGYAFSKALVALSSAELAEKYSKKPIYVVTIHPGAVMSELYRSNKILSIITKYVIYPLRFMLHPKQGALSIIWAALHLSDEEFRTKYNGCYISEMKIRPMPFVHPNNPRKDESLTRYIDQAHVLTKAALDNYEWATEQEP